MKRRPVLALVLSALAGGSAAAASPDVRSVFLSDDGQFEILASTTLLAPEAQQIAARAQAAYRWLSGVQQWSDTSRLASHIKIRVIDRSGPGPLGAAGVNSLVMSPSYLRDDVPLSSGTLAHELCHIQDARQGKPNSLPGFITEGRGLTNGFMYRKSLGYPPQRYDRGLAATIVHLTPEQIKVVVTRLESGDVPGAANGALEFGGAWFVEWLRTGFDHAGFPDVQPRLARVIISLHDGAKFDAAFRSAFGVEFADVQQAFLEHATSSVGPERLRNTIWDGLVS